MKNLKPTIHSTVLLAQDANDNAVTQFPICRFSTQIGIYQKTKQMAQLLMILRIDTFGYLFR
jgi:hypothetical protein